MHGDMPMLFTTHVAMQVTARTSIAMRVACACAMPMSVARDMLPRGRVVKWAVSHLSGTATFLLKCVRDPNTPRAQASALLNELFHRFCCRSCLWATNFQQAVGAALCWSRRRAAATDRCQKINFYVFRALMCLLFDPVRQVDGVYVFKS